jgi:plastocyanin
MGRPPAGIDWRYVCLLSVIAVAAIGVVPGSLAGGAVGMSAAAQQPAGRIGSVRGRVDIGQLAHGVERRPGVSDLGARRARDEPDRTRSVVYLEFAPQPAFDLVDPGRASMDQRNETFVPHVLAVTAGTTVDFPNSDRFYHNVFSLSKAARFDLGRYATGKSKSVAFNQPGIVRVFCEIHSHMNAFILVFAHPFFSLTDGEGRYRINNVPAGTYNVIAWNEGISSEPKPVMVTAGGVAELDLAVR